MYIPEGFATVAPYIFVENADQYGRFLVEALGGHETGRTVRPDGLIANLQIRIGTATLMLSDATEGYPPTQSAYYLYVENADCAMAQALKCGATLEMEVADMPYDDRQGGVRDPVGNIWWISQRLTAAPYF